MTEGLPLSFGVFAGSRAGVTSVDNIPIEI